MRGCNGFGAGNPDNLVIMSMLTRTGTTIRKHRRRQSGKSRRGSAPTILLPSSATPVTPVSFNIDVNENALLNLQASPAKSVSFTLEKGYSPIPSSASREVEVVSTHIRSALVLPPAFHILCESSFQHKF